jgi:hypothetical protein
VRIVEESYMVPCTKDRTGAVVPIAKLPAAPPYRPYKVVALRSYLAVEISGRTAESYVDQDPELVAMLGDRALAEAKWTLQEAILVFIRGQLFK